MALNYLKRLNFDINKELDQLHKMEYYIEEYMDHDNLDEKDKIIIDQSKSMREALNIIDNQNNNLIEQNRIIHDLEDKIEDLDVDNIVRIKSWKILLK